jgi:hypothetical protein
VKMLKSGLLALDEKAMSIENGYYGENNAD